MLNVLERSSCFLIVIRVIFISACMQLHTWFAYATMGTTEVRILKQAYFSKKLRDM